MTTNIKSKKQSILQRNDFVGHLAASLLTIAGILAMILIAIM